MKKRGKNEIVRGIQDTLEGYRRFDFRYIPVGDSWTMPDASFRYRRKGLDKLAVGFWRTLLCLLGPILIKVAYGAKVVGKENLRAIRKSGAISVCNHFNFLDTLFVRQAVGHFRSFHTMGPWNNKKGLGGHIVRHGGMWPFSADRTAMRNLMREMETRLAEGKIVNFYAEQVMWINYQKPRPMKDGAFHYAVKFRVPVLPIFCTFGRNKKGHIRNLRIHILPAIYPDETLAKSAFAQEMKARAEAEWRACYEEAYGVPLEYLPDRRTPTSTPTEDRM